MIGYVLTVSLFHMTNSFSAALIYICFTYIIDLDGFASLFLSSRNTPESIVIRKNIRAFDIESAAIHATRYHKKFNRLVVHNIIGFVCVFMVMGFAIHFSHPVLLIATSAILFHFFFDIWDDWYQLGHINNWLWPIRNIRHRI